MLNHGQFQDLLVKINSQYSNPFYLCEVHWLSRRKMLEEIFDLGEEIENFLEEEKFGASEF